MNLSNFQVSLVSAAIATILLSILFNWITLKRTKDFIPKNRKNEKRLSSRYVPPFGGIACSIAFLVSTRLLGQAESNFLYIGFFGVIISIIGLLDDLYNFKWFNMSSEKIERKIAVIFATDVVGYSKHMETDEVETVQLKARTY